MDLPFLEESCVGRKRRQDVWSHFCYINTEDKTRCIVPDQYGVPCGHKIGGKNTTNLKRHLRLRHPEVSALIPETVYAHKVTLDRERPQSSVPNVLAFGLNYPPDEEDPQAKERALALWIGRSGLPARTVEDRDFVNMMEVMDRTLTLPTKDKLSSIMEEIYRDEKRKFTERLSTARRITVGLDIWTAKGVGHTFLAVSAGYFCTMKNEPEQILLNLKQIPQPLTAQSVRACVNHCTEMWGIPEHKVITVLTDNGRKSVAAYKLAEEGGNSSSSSDESGEEEESEEDVKEEVDTRYGDIERTPCFLHTLQMVINVVHRDDSLSRILRKVKSVVRHFRKSSRATAKLRQLCGLSLIRDSKTRWSGTFQMISRLLQVKDSVARVADDMGWDCFLPSEWIKMAAVQEILLPFAEHTKTLHSDTMTLSLVVPALLDLMAHLSQFSLQSAHGDLQGLADRLRAELQERFSCFLRPSDPKFSPLAAAACLLDPTVAGDALIDNVDEGIQELLSEAEKFILFAATPPLVKKEEECDYREEPAREEPASPKRPRFRFLSTKSASSKLSKQPQSHLALQDLRKYKEDLSLPGSCPHEQGIHFWLEPQNSASYVSLRPLALDLLAMPASQAFVKRAFSVTADLTKVRNKKARAALERSAFLRLNRDK